MVGERRQRALLAALVGALAVAVFVPALGHEWLNYDDDFYVTANPALAAGLGRDGVAWAFTTFYGANWFPLTWLSWLLDYELHGLDAGGFRATNIALHALASAVLFLALARLTGRPGRSLFVAAVFAVHPLHVEPVAWVAGRKDPLSALFFALALLVYAIANERPRRARAWRLALFACFACGLMAKPTVVTLPFVLLLLDDWPLGRLRRRDDPLRWDPVRIRAAVVEKLPLLALAGAFAAVVVLAQDSAGMVASLDRLPLRARAENALVAGVLYLTKSFWPTGLAPIYPHPEGGLPWWQPAGAALVLATLSAGAALAARRRPALAVGWLWFLGMLVPVIGLVQVGSQAMADRYLYLPLVGLSLAVTWGLADRLGPRAGVALAAAAVAALTATSSLQLRHWRDSETLFRHTLRVTSENAVAHAQLGAALLETGRAEEALSHYGEALRIEPAYLEVANNVAWLRATAQEPELRDAAEAIELAERASALSGRADPGVLDTLAAAYAAAGRFGDARRTLAEAIDLAEAADRPELAALLRSRERLYRAGFAYREPVATDPTHHRLE